MSNDGTGGSERSTVKLVLVYLLFPGILIANAVLFEVVLDRSYVDWYLAEGPLISLSTSFVMTVWDDLEGLTGDLVSKHPLRYYRTCLVVASVMFATIATNLDAGTGSGSGSLSDVWDVLVALALFVIVAVLVFAWVIVVAPMNYLVTLVSGAPARLWLRRPDYEPTLTVWLGADPSSTSDPFRSGSEAAGTDITSTPDPFALTQLLTALVLLLVGSV